MTSMPQLAIMSTPSEPRLRDDASQEAWFQKGVNLLEGQKQALGLEEKLRRQMRRSVMHEVHFWLGMMWVVMLFFNAGKPGNDPINYIAVICSVVFFATAVDGAAAKRSLAMLEWMEHRQGGDKPEGKDTGLL